MLGDSTLSDNEPAPRLDIFPLLLERKDVFHNMVMWKCARGKLDDIDHCWERLRNLAEHAQTELREQAAEIARSFTAQADQGDIDQLKQRVLDELAAKTRAPDFPL